MNELFQRFMAFDEDNNPEFILSSALLGSLPESYDGLVTALEARSEQLTSSLVCSKVIAEYKRRKERNKENNEEVALRVGAPATGGEINCFFCKGKGHYKKNCEKYKKWLIKKQQEGSQVANLTESCDNGAVVEFLFSTAVIDGGWIVDSGATCHIVGSRNSFINFNKDHREKVYVANGHQVTAIGKGTVCVNFVTKNGDTSAVRITDVLYVPNIKGNVISVKRLADKGYTVNFS